jgi:hypothetical protein
MLLIVLKHVRTYQFVLLTEMTSQEEKADLSQQEVALETFKICVIYLAKVLGEVKDG